MALSVLFAGLVLSVAPPPAPNAPLPRSAAQLAEALTVTTADIGTEVAHWTPKSVPPPNDLVLRVLYQQRLYRLLARNAKLGDATLRYLPVAIRRLSVDLLNAQRELYRLTPPLRTARIKVGRAPAAATLVGYYREAERRFGVSWNVLAAVNFVESKFGKLRNSSAAGAQGPMQFMPATWRAYGLGGNVHDPHDAVLGAANYLHASGAPRNLRRALHSYNPSTAYVDAVLRYARTMRTAFYVLYNWQVFIKTAHGDRRVTGPGLP
jgi:soluble lytic murein transglycosylase-like protein